MKKVYYEKIGRRYKPVAEYDSNYIDSFPKGATLVVCRPGMSSRRYNVDIALAPLIAAGMYAEDAISNAVLKAGELRPVQSLITDEQKEAYDKYLATLPDWPDRHYLTFGSAREAAEAGVKALQTEANKLLSNESVRKAYDHFLLMCKLTKDQND
jgi:hypothetical protein